VDSKIIQQERRFNYLGVEVSSERNFVKEALTQAIKAATVSRYLRDIIGQNKMMNTTSNLKIYKDLH